MESDKRRSAQEQVLHFGSSTQTRRINSDTDWFAVAREKGKKRKRTKSGDDTTTVKLSTHGWCCELSLDHSEFAAIAREKERKRATTVLLFYYCTIQLLQYSSTGLELDASRGYTGLTSDVTSTAGECVKVLHASFTWKFTHLTSA